MACAENQETEEKELTALNIINHLKTNEFLVNTHWVLFVRLLGLTWDEVVPHERSSNLDKTIELAFEDCLEIWLRNDEKCSWVEVKAAMYDLKHQHPATVILYLYRPRLIAAFNECFTLHIVVEKLKAEGFTSSIDGQYATADSVFELVSSSIESEPRCLMKLIAVLRKFPNGCSEVSHQLDLECARYNFTSPPPKEQPKKVSIPLSPTLEEEFEDVVAGFGYLKLVITDLLASAITDSPACIGKLKRYLRSTKRFGDELETFESLKSLIEYAVTRISSILNIVHLKKLVKIFGIQEGIEELERYKECKNRVCEKIKANELINTRLCQVDPLKCETVEFTVKWNVEETLLEDIEKLLSLAFEDLKCEILVTKLRKGNSIIITCYAPESLINLLILKAQQNLALLKEKGVMSLTIGYCELLNHKTDYEINRPLHEEIELLKNEKSQIETDLVDARAELKSIKLETEEIEEKPYSGELLAEKHDESDEIKEKTKGKTYMHSMEELEPEQKELNIEDDVMKTAPTGDIDDEEINTETEAREKFEGNDQGKIYQLTRRIDELEDILEFKTLESSGTHREIQILRDGRKSLEVEISTLKQKIGQSTSLESDISELRQKLNQYSPLKSEVSSLRQKLGETVPLLFFNSGIQSPPVNIVMSNFNNWRKSRDHWFSPAFYSHPEGYKLCLKIRASGQEEGEGTHVSVYAHIMSGENDHKLQWPFRGKVKVRLLNRRGDSNHIDATIDFGFLGKEDTGARVDGGLRIASGTAAVSGKGVPKWVKHEDLNYDGTRGTEYLHEDALFMCVKEVVVDTQAPPSTTAGLENVLTFTNVADFKLDGYSKLKAKSGKWERMTFHTHPKGYKFMLIVHANGKDDFKGKSISVFTHLMKGDHDDNLRFPFRGFITVRLVNQKEDRNHVQFCIKYTEESDPKGKKGGRIKTFSTDNLFAGRSYNGWGYPNFVGHEFLYFDSDRNTQYVTDNDELQFKISDVTIISV